MQTDNNAKSTFGDQPSFPAFSMDDVGDITGHSGGLTKREYFAAMAMQGMLASGLKIDMSNPIGSLKRLSKNSIVIADALLNELNKTHVKQTR